MINAPSGKKHNINPKPKSPKTSIDILIIILNSRTLLLYNVLTSHIRPTAKTTLITPRFNNQ